MASQNGKANPGKGSGAADKRYGHLFGESTTKQGLDAAWNEVDPVVLRDCIWAIDALGGSVTIGTNKKGTAYYFKVYLSAPFDPVYFDGSAEGRAALGEWVEQLVAAAAAAG